MLREATRRFCFDDSTVLARIVTVPRGLAAYRQGMTNVTTPWGRATVVEEAVLEQEAGGRAFSSLVQLLEGEAGDQLVRFAYSTGGAARRGPVTLRADDLERLREALRERRRLAKALGLRPAR
jgi:hypothetical protein